MIVIVPTNEIEEILQNIKTIITTYKGSVPLMRDFGIDANIVDDLINPSIKQKLKNNIVKQVEIYEPRAKVKEVDIYIENEKLYIWMKVYIEGDTYEVKIQ